MRLAFASAVVLAVTGCGGGYDLSVDVRTDLVVGTEVTSTTTEVVRTGTTTRAVSHNFASTDDVARGTRIATFSGVQPGDYTVRVTLYSPGGITVVSRSVLVSLHGHLATTVVITRDCRGVHCPTAADPTATTCAGGRCVNPSCTDATMTCGTECALDTECASSAACAIGRCDHGLCLFEPITGACASDEWCDPDVGCMRLAPPDAGTADMGTPPPDLGPPDLGLPDLGPPPPTGLWVLPSGASAWSVYDRPGGTRAPTTAVRDAFSLDGCDAAYAVTDTTYHVLSLSSLAWSDSGARDAIFPQLTGRTVGSAFGTPPRTPGCQAQTVIFLSGTDAFVYDWTPTPSGALPGTFTYNQVVAMPWATDPAAPNPTTVVADWLSLENPPGWVTGSPYDVCAGGPSMPAPGSVYGPYSAFITSDARVYLQDDGYCDVFVASVPYGAFAPFTLPGAPAFSDVGAAFHASGALWVMAE